MVKFLKCDVQSPEKAAYLLEKSRVLILLLRPEKTFDVVRECAELGIRRVWMHRSFGDGNVSEEAVRICREHGIAVIPGACPLMFCRSADLGHRCMRWWLGVRGGLPEPEAAGHREV